MREHNLPEDNPLRNYGNPLADLQEGLKALRENPEHVRFERLCYELFVMNPAGIELYEMLKEKYVVGMEFYPAHAQASNIAMYNEGIKGAIKGLMASAKGHEARIKHGQPTT